MTVFACRPCHMHSYMLLDKGMVLHGKSICQQISTRMLSIEKRTCNR